MNKEHLYSGKGKSIFASDNPKQIIMHFRDDLTAFNGEKKAECPGKGIYNNNINAHLMSKLAAKGIKTCFVEMLNPRESLTLKLDMIKLEFVVRNFAAGTIVKRVGIAKGAELSPPIQELFLKDDKLGDPFINLHYVNSMKIAPMDIVIQAEKISLQVNEVIQDVFAKVNVDLVDFKLEFGTLDGELYLGDEISPDTCRLWDTTSKSPFDKDLFRFNLGDVKEGYEKICQLLGLKVNMDSRINNAAEQAKNNARR